MISESYLLGNWVLLVLRLLRCSDYDVVPVAVDAHAAALASQTADQAILRLGTARTGITRAKLSRARVSRLSTLFL